MDDHVEDLLVQARRRDLRRRTLDVVISAVLAVLTLPIVAIAAVGSAVALRAWPFFVQERVGRDGELFRFVKVRTLPTEVPRYTDKHSLSAYRIPWFCRLLRELHLDELPQLYLVLAGRMSLVGPRPEMAALHEQMAPAFAAERTTVRPGCTGLWQVSAACSELIHASPEYDRFYLFHRTLRFDLWILARTVIQMVGLGRPALLEDVPPWVVSTKRVAQVYVIDLRDGGFAEAAAPLPVAAGH